MRSSAYVSRVIITLRKFTKISKNTKNTKILDISQR